MGKQKKGKRGAGRSSQSKKSRRQRNRDGQVTQNRKLKNVLLHNGVAAAEEYASDKGLPLAPLLRKYGR